MNSKIGIPAGVSLLLVSGAAAHGVYVVIAPVHGTVYAPFMWIGVFALCLSIGSVWCFALGIATLIRVRDTNDDAEGEDPVEKESNSENTEEGKGE